MLDSLSLFYVLLIFLENWKLLMDMHPRFAVQGRRFISAGFFLVQQPIMIVCCLVGFFFFSFLVLKKARGV
jgi:hypothetical protein